MALLKATGDFVTTVISTGSQLSAGGTSMTIGTGLTLPATNGVLQIDYDSTEALGAASGPETVSYATYTSGTGAVAGMTRGLAGTTGVTHENGASVQCAPSAAYGGQGAVLTADISDAQITNAKLSTTAGECGGVWKSWTPSWTNLTVGGGTVDAKYTQIGKTVHIYLSFVFGSGSVVGSNPDFTLPVTGARTAAVIGNVYVLDATTADYFGALSMGSTTKALPRPYQVTGVAIAYSMTAITPMTWAIDDVLVATGTYEAA